MGDYSSFLESYLKKSYEIAKSAREKGLDPESDVEIAITRDLAERVESLVGPEGIAERIRELSKIDREEAALIIAREIVENLKSNPEKAAEQAIRTALAVATEGVVAAPLEGIVKAAIKENFDRTKYLAVYFAGPIRSAGGSAQALAVLTADYVRESLSLSRYKPTEDEIERFVQEVERYDREASKLQYFPSAEEVRAAIKNIPIEITGEGTEKVEVSGYRDLPRIETNQLRGGAILVLAEGVLQKAPKIIKYVKKFKISGWEWLEELKKAGEKSKGEIKSEEAARQPSTKYLRELIAGRPLFSHPSTKGGFRLRYGRTRCSGLAGIALHPATMHILDDFIAVGTQIKIERPGKAGVAMPCDKIEGPIVKLSDGSVVRVETLEQAHKIRGRVKEILFIGDILIGYGEFLENNHILMPAGYCEEWWEKELEKLGIEYEKGKTPTQEEALALCRKGIPLHPRYTYFFHDISKEELKTLALWLCTGEIKEYDAENGSSGTALFLKKSRESEILEKLCIPFEVGESIILKEYKPLLAVLGLTSLNPENFLKSWEEKSDVMDIVNSFGIKVRMKAPTYIGARMGRPEKAKPRKMQPPINVLFPVGNYGGRTRELEKAAEHGTIEAEVAVRVCEKCRKESDSNVCGKCGGRAFFKGYGSRKINLALEYEKAVKKIGKPQKPVKGVIGLISTNKVPESIEKGILRANHGLYVFRDGTARFDATDAPLTHFKPCEIGITAEKARELGYEKDYRGNEIKNDRQTAELEVQDIIVPEEGGEYLLKVSKFVDELLSKFYGEEPFYNANSKEDLIGHLVLALAPHTSAAVLGRIIGFTKANVLFAHPFFHAAKRRNCDGDEDSVFLLLDALLNFSKSYLPGTRGGKMDAPLVLTTEINHEEIDDEAYNVDTGESYPLEFYEATLRYAKPEEVRGMVKLYEDDFSSGSFTHDTSNIAAGTLKSAYLSLTEMKDKLEKQLELADKIKAVDKKDVAIRIIETHFLPDLAGNLTAFSKQTIRCVACNAKYRRVPLSGSCRACGGKLVLTVSKGSVEKYLVFIKEMIEKYALDSYLKQRITILERSIDTIFPEKEKKQIMISDFLT